MCARLSASTGVSTVVLGGGVFLNRFLLVNAKEQLQKLGFVVHCHRQVPANDGGISLGQVSIAAHQLETANR